MMNLLLFDDHPIITSGVEQQLKQTNLAYIQLVSVCNTVPAVFERLKQGDIDIVVADVLTQEDDGLSLFEHLNQKYPHIMVIVFSSIKADFIIEQLFGYGVSSFINKNKPISALINELEALTTNVKPKSSNYLSTKPVLKITKREKELIDFAIQGLASKQIADKLDVSMHTVNNQKNALLKRFNCASTTELVVKLSQLGLINIL